MIGISVYSKKRHKKKGKKKEGRGKKGQKKVPSLEKSRLNRVEKRRENRDQELGFAQNIRRGKKGVLP